MEQFPKSFGCDFVATNVRSHIRHHHIRPTAVKVSAGEANSLRVEITDRSPPEFRITHTIEFLDHPHHGHHLQDIPAAVEYLQGHLEQELGLVCRNPPEGAREITWNVRQHLKEFDQTPLDVRASVVRLPPSDQEALLVEVALAEDWSVTTRFHYLNLSWKYEDLVDFMPGHLRKELGLE